MLLCKKNHVFLTLQLALLPTLLLMAQESRTLRGIVQDSVTGEPLIAATIQVGGASTISGTDGTFELQYLSGVNDLIIKYIGYHTYKDTLGPTSEYLEVPMRQNASLLGEITVSTGKYERSLGESTASIEVLSAGLIESNNTTAVNEVLDKVPGVNIIDGQANIRGGSGYSYGAGSRVMMLLDDIPALQVDAGFPNWSDYPVESVAQVEVLKGSASAIYGSAAINGIINLRTAYATAEPRTKASIFYGHYMDPKNAIRKWWTRAPYEYGGSISDARRIGKVDLVLGGYYLKRESYRKEDFTHYGRANANVRYRISSQAEAGVAINFNRGSGRSMFYWRDAEEGAYIGTEDNTNISERTRYTVDPFFRYSTKGGSRHELKTRFFSIANDNNAGRSNHSKSYYGEYQYLKRWSDLGLVLTGGLVGSHTNVDADLYSDTILVATNWAMYAQIEKKFWDRLTFDFGARFETNFIDGPNQVNGETVPDDAIRESKPVFRSGANFRIWENTFLRASWGQGYRYPTIAERYISTVFGPLRVSANPLVRSETGWTAEIGVRQGVELGGLKAVLDVAAYWSEYQDMMEFVLTGLILGFQSQNIGDTRIKGIDVSLSGRGDFLGGSASFLAGYTYVDPRFQEFTKADRDGSSVDFNILKYRSRNLAKLDFENSWQKLTVGLSIQHTSRMVAVDEIFNLFIPGLTEFRETHREYTITDLRVRYQLTSLIKASVLLKNVFNVEYSVRPGLLEAPRNIALRFDFQF